MTFRLLYVSSTYFISLEEASLFVPGVEKLLVLRKLLARIIGERLLLFIFPLENVKLIRCFK